MERRRSAGFMAIGTRAGIAVGAPSGHLASEIALGLVFGLVLARLASQGAAR